MMSNSREPVRINDLIAVSDGRLRDLGAEIKHQRILQGLTVHDLSQMIGVLEVTLQRMESDCSKARLRTVERVCRALKMSVQIGERNGVTAK